MKSKLLLRIASGAMLFHLIGHTFGHTNWKHDANPERQEVINQMMNHQFPFMGAIRSMGDYYEGYGWASAIAILFFALILWLVSGAVKENTSLATKILVVTTICLFAWSIDEFIFFFPFAACVTLLAGILTLVAIIQIRNQKL
ncbi:MAG TPA: hypothetical protein VE978_18695 [Chitinophagales bacterium]|nr:hypothetical protein [Chitinophagales bacterium]